MKIKVEVDLSEFYSEEDDVNFSAQIKSTIAYNVKQQILQDWRDKIGAEFSAEIKSEIEKQKGDLISSTVKACFDAKLVKEKYGSEMVSIEKYVEQILDNDLRVSNIFQDTLRNITNEAAKVISKQLKDRYDLLFASSLVSKMNELGMLKPDVAQLILSENK
jgi:hypothetical protein